MTETDFLQADRSAGLRPPRVLVFSVDDGLFALHIDWVEAMYPRAATAVHEVRDGKGRQQPFVLHAGEPAMLIDLRDAFALTDLLGTAARREVLIVRAPGFLLAVPVDACVGIRDLDLEQRPPVPSGLMRDGGFPVAHLAMLDSKPMAVLDPKHLLEARERDALAPLVQKARAFEERERRIESLWAEICAQPSATAVRTYARLSSRNGRARAAAAARLVLRHLTGGGRLGDEGVGEQRPAGAADGGRPQPLPASTVALVESQVAPQERLIRELVCLAGESVTGELIIPQGDGAEEARLYLASGRVTQARCGAERGRAAFKQLLASHPEHFYFVETAADPAEQRIGESTAALIISTIEALSIERRGRRARAPRVEH